MWKFHYFLSAFIFLLAVLCISRLLRERRSPGSIVAWLLLMILVPYLGIPLFLALGTRKIKRFASLDGHPRSNGVHPRSSGGEIQMLRSGEEAYAALVRSLQSANQSICVATYLLRLDPVGRSILAILEERARAGVSVRLLLDGLGSFWVPSWRLKGLRRAGGKVSHFLPLIHLPFRGHSNLRNHRKMVVVDGKEAIVGGMNLATEYMGPRPTPGRWKDLSMIVHGPAVGDFLDIFAKDWVFASGEQLPMAQEKPKRGESAGSGVGGEELQVVACGPDVPGDPLYDSILSAIFAAKDRIWIATPYFIPDDTISKALELAAKRGVDVRLLIPRQSNHFLADICRGGYVQQLDQSGGRIFYNPVMMHGKALIVDDHYAMVGSANIDMRSLLLNYEVGLFIYSPRGVQQVCEWYEKLRSKAAGGSLPRSFGRDLLEGIGRVLGPFL